MIQIISCYSSIILFIWSTKKAHKKQFKKHSPQQEKPKTFKTSLLENTLNSNKLKSIVISMKIIYIYL